MKSKIGFGGGCHWCTEAVFSMLEGVEKVEQGWIKSTQPYDTYSEAVVVHYDPKIIYLSLLIKVHLETHSSAANHSMRSKYRSAVYYFQDEDKKNSQSLLKDYSVKDNKAYITLVLPFVSFEINKEQFWSISKRTKMHLFVKLILFLKLIT
jgi:peptide-methionine (S)-S-oxide reductase